MVKKTYNLKTSSKKEIKLNYHQDLNPEQWSVVSTADGPCLVLAGAGSGKTRTLVYRVAYLLEQGIPADKILLMTFTNKAAKEMLWRVEQLLGYKPHQLWGGTFHHIGNLILRKNIHSLGYKTNYSIFDEDDAQTLLQSILAEKNMKKDKYFPKSGVLKNIISFSKNSGQTIEKIYQEKFSYLKENFLPTIVDIANQYEQRKQQHNALDYDDLLLLWLKLMETKPAIKNKLTNKFQYILVDEYQDTNRLQAKIIEHLGDVHKNILVVGDDAQSIYSFRAADISNILQFPKKIPGTKIFKLESNYRSTPEILNLANDSIKHNLNQFPKKLITTKASGEKPVLVNAQNNQQQAEFISQRIIELTEEGYNLRDIAVLFRADWHALELEIELNKKNIPYLKRGGIKFFEQAHLKDIIAFLKIKYNPRDEIAWTRILNLQTGIGRVGAQKIINALPPLSLEEILQAKINLPPNLNSAWQKFINNLEKFIKFDSNDIDGCIGEIMNTFYTLYLQTKYDNATKRIEDIEQLENFAASYQALDKFLSDISLSENFRVEDAANQNSEPDDFLILSTIHQAKGLEWPIVFIINLISGQFPHAKTMENKDEIEEERRLFYVAVTRAQNLLYLIYPNILYNQYYGFIFSQPSEFIQELEENLYDSWQVATDSDDELPTIEYD